MPSFRSFLQVAGREYPITYFDFSFQQHVDHLGRPASLVYGGVYNIEIHPPGSNDNTLYEWMANPTKQYTGQVVIKQLNADINLKVVRFVSAYCVDMTERFDGTTSTAPLTLHLRISPEKVIMDGIKHDNRWPNPTDGDGVMGDEYAAMNQLVAQMNTRPARIPPAKPAICADVDKATKGKDKKERYAARMAVIEAARQKPGLKGDADQFELNNRAIERAKLANNIYNLDKRQFYRKELDKELRGHMLVTPGIIMPTAERVYDTQKIADLRAKMNSYPETLEPPEGWTVQQRSPPGQEPVFVVYTSTFEPDAKPVLVFRGTDNAVNAGQDWWTNILQGNGLDSRQYNGSIRKAQQMQQQYGPDGFEVVGHSKAGGQAAAAGIVTGAKTYTFNAAGVHHRTVERVGGFSVDDAKKTGPDGKPLVDAFNFPHDILSNVQDKVMPALEGGLIGTQNPAAMVLGAGLLLNQTMPPAAGVRHTVPAQDIDGKPISSPWNPFKRVDYHGMPYLIDSMEREKQTQLATMAKQLGCQ